MHLNPKTKVHEYMHSSSSLEEPAARSRCCRREGFFLQSYTYLDFLVQWHGKENERREKCQKREEKREIPEKTRLPQNSLLRSRSRQFPQAFKIRKINAIVVVVYINFTSSSFFVFLRSYSSPTQYRQHQVFSEPLGCQVVW